MHIIVSIEGCVSWVDILPLALRHYFDFEIWLFRDWKIWNNKNKFDEKSGRSFISTENLLSQVIDCKKRPSAEKAEKYDKTSSGPSDVKD